MRALTADSVAACLPHPSCRPAACRRSSDFSARLDMEGLVTAAGGDSSPLAAGSWKAGKAHANADQRSTEQMASTSRMAMGQPSCRKWVEGEQLKSGR